MSTKNELKKLFYSNLTSLEIQLKLNIDNAEYKTLLQEVKEELGLPSNYRRTPHRYGKYVKNSYFIKKYVGSDDFEIITYAPTYEDAETKLRLFDDGISVYTIEQATDEHMKKLIQYDYFTKKLRWNDIIKKYQIPYHKFYDLLNQIKQEMGLINARTVNPKRYIYKYNRNGKYFIRKNIKGKRQGFGYYDDLDVAVKVRDKLEEMSWNLTRWQNERDIIIEEAEHGY